LIRFFITELPILPVSAEAPITATISDSMMRFIWRTMSSWFRDAERGGGGAKSTTMRTVGGDRRSDLVANTGLEVHLGNFGKVGDQLET